MSEAIQDIVNPGIVGAWSLFHQVLSGISGLSNYLLYTIMIFMVFRFILAPVLRIHLGRIQAEIASGSDKAKPREKKRHTRDYWEHKKQKEKYKQ